MSLGTGRRCAGTGGSSASHPAKHHHSERSAAIQLPLLHPAALSALPVLSLPDAPRPAVDVGGQPVLHAAAAAVFQREVSQEQGQGTAASREAGTEVNARAAGVSAACGQLAASRF